VAHLNDSEKEEEKRPREVRGGGGRSSTRGEALGPDDQGNPMK